MNQDTHKHGSKPRNPMFDQDGGKAAKPQAQPAPRRTSPGVPSPGEVAARNAAAGRSPQPAANSQRPAARKPNQPLYAPARPSGGTKQNAGRKCAPRRRKKKAGALPIVLLLIFAVLGTAFYAVYNSVQNRISGKETEAGTIPEEVWTPPEYKGKGIVNFLVVGICYDNEDGSAFTGDDKIGNTDMLMYVHYDTSKNKMSVMQIPRDVYVGADASTGGTGKINGLYRNAKDTDNRMAAITKVLMDQYKLPTDFYVSVDVDALHELVAVKGYIHMYLPMDIDHIDPKNPDDAWKKGWQYFDSSTIMLLLRNRYSSTYNQQQDIGRLAMQQSFYSALYREFTTLSPKDLAMWLGVLLDKVKTDNDNLVDLSGLAMKALNLKSENITFVRPSVSGADYNSHSLLSLVPEDAADLFNEYLRPEGESYTVDELDIPSLPVNYIGTVPRSVRTMGDIQSVETPPES